MSPPPSARPPLRRRRFIFFAILLVTALFVFGVPWELPPSLKDGNLQSALSRANIANLVQSKLGASSDAKVNEIYGLLHLVTSGAENEHILSQADLDPTKPISLKVYAAGNTTIDWVKEVEILNEEYPIVVFSKVCLPHDVKLESSLIIDLVF